MDPKPQDKDVLSNLANWRFYSLKIDSRKIDLFTLNHTH